MCAGHNPFLTKVPARRERGNREPLPTLPHHQYPSPDKCEEKEDKKKEISGPAASWVGLLLILRREREREGGSGVCLEDRRSEKITPTGKRRCRLSFRWIKGHVQEVPILPRSIAIIWEKYVIGNAIIHTLARNGRYQIPPLLPSLSPGSRPPTPTFFSPCSLCCP